MKGLTSVVVNDLKKTANARVSEDRSGKRDRAEYHDSSMVSRESGEEGKTQVAQDLRPHGGDS